MTRAEMNARLLAWSNVEDERDDDIAASALPDAVLAMDAESLRAVRGLEGVALVNYLERIVARGDRQRCDDAIKSLGELIAASDELVAQGALAYAFYYDPTDERAATVAQVLASFSNPGYSVCISAVKQLLASGIPTSQAIARRAIELVDTSPDELAALRDDLAS